MSRPLPFICTKCGHLTNRYECPWHGREPIRTRDQDEIEAELAQLIDEEDAEA